MGKWSLGKLPEGSRYESSCQVHPRGDIDPPWFGFPGVTSRWKDGSTFYLTSNGDICTWPESKSFPPLVALSLRDVSKVEYHPKRIVHPNKYFMFRSACLIMGILLLILVALSILDFIFNFEYYYYFAPDPSNTESTSTNYGDVVSETIWQFKIMVGILIPVYVFVYCVNNVHLWAERERMDFETRSGGVMSFYGKLPLQRWITVSYYGWYLYWVACAPVHYLKPFVAVPLLFAAILYFAFIVLIKIARDFLNEADFDPDEFIGDAKIKPLEGFYLDVLKISNGDLGEEQAKDNNIQFKLLIDRLGKEVEELARRLRSHEMDLNKILDHRWKWTHQVAEIDIALNQIRKVAERILGHRVSELGVELGRKPDLIALKKILESNDGENTSDGVLSQIDVINAVCGRGSHAAKKYVDNEDDYIISLRSLVSIVDWHFENPVELHVPSELPATFE